MKKPDFVNVKVITHWKIEQKPSQIVRRCYLRFIFIVVIEVVDVCTKVQPEYVEVHHRTANCIGWVDE